MENIIDSYNGKSLENMTSEEKMDMMIGLQVGFQNSVVRLEEKDKEKDEKIDKITKQLDSVSRIVNERLKIDEDTVKDIKDEIAKKIRKFCTNHNLIYKIWSQTLFKAAYGEIKRICRAGSLTRILFSKKDLAVATATNMDLEDLEKVKILLVEARINDGKRLKVDIEKENYLYEAIRYHIVVAQDWQVVSREQIFQEAAINEANAIKY